MSTSASPPSKLLQALRYLLEPLVRLLLDHGMAFPALAELLKRVYVDVAERDFALPGKTQTDSRISVLTGVHRKDVKRLRETADAPLDLERTSHVSLQAQLLAKWLGDPQFQDEHGRPRPLPRLAHQGALSFEQMVNDISKDVRARVFLDEWRRTDLVRLDEHDIVHLNVAALLQSPALEEKMDFFGRNIHDHLSAVVSNLEGQAAPYMDRCVFYHGLTEEQVQQLKQRAEQLSMDALLEINRIARGMVEQNQSASADATQRMHFGAYFYHAAETQETTTDPS
ncbi:MAG: hypothetical protein JO171_05450 [Paludibacterium sp.]|uniref:DUF6502 family protein n=1 Tax=Paludibacterium sp. TaxID=1917523 RepID=UPI0025D372FE|nr:DUF6502 family protein [Paludibacterium sp.]MBV8046574.1 hypothetical protein [Paludibacterium sp.]MBV8647051.1 hypothetical protein [Paludibacterium sp.]